MYAKIIKSSIWSDYDLTRQLLGNIKSKKEDMFSVRDIYFLLPSSSVDLQLFFFSIGYTSLFPLVNVSANCASPSRHASRENRCIWYLFVLTCDVTLLFSFPWYRNEIDQNIHASTDACPTVKPVSKIMHLLYHIVLFLSGNRGVIPCYSITPGLYFLQTIKITKKKRVI